MATAAGMDIFCANLEALRSIDAELALRIERAEPASLTWDTARSGQPCATVEHAGKPLALASRFDPLAEADNLIADVDPSRHGGVVLLGLGLGYHAQRAWAKLGAQSALIVYEPDTGLLRATLERIDHTSWLGQPNVVLADGAVDRAMLTRRLERFAGTLTQGTILVTHPATRRMRGEKLHAFGQMVAEVLAFCRTNIATTLVNASRTIRNLVMNLPHYAGGATTDELLHAARGFPAVCVAAGPSLAKNIDLLRDPRRRESVVVISAQTTLKPLLDRGIKPDFVTALDHHEISRRFYENLGDATGVTLVAEPLANCAILDHFPAAGGVRITHHRYLDLLLGPERARPRIHLRHGATVAHLSFYLAQFLGCDPVILIGQDLGFSDGLYYCPGTAIHDVWAPELGAFNTLEMLEWQRIVRHRTNLSKQKDIHGRDIYSDEQMLTYHRQFERDFAAAEQTVIDATEGGLPKAHTRRLTLAEALNRYAVKPIPPGTIPAAPRGLDGARLAAAAEALDQRLEQFRELNRLNTEAVGILRQMLEHQRDAARMDRLFARMGQVQDRVAALGQAFELLNELNTIGAFKRDRADRAIRHAGVDALEKQRRQIQRDLENIDWLTQACEEGSRIFLEGRRRLAGFLERPCPT